MFIPQQVQGPVAPGAPGAFSPQQVSAPSAYYPMQTDQMGGMIQSMMPMFMMIMMMAMIMPMMKGITGETVRSSV